MSLSVSFKDILLDDYGLATCPNRLVDIAGQSGQLHVASGGSEVAQGLTDGYSGDLVDCT